MKELLNLINSKTNWGKNELAFAINDIASAYTKLVMAKRFMLTAPENTKENIVVDTCLHMIAKIQKKNSWGSKELKEILLIKLVEELEVDDV